MLENKKSTSASIWGHVAVGIFSLTRKTMVTRKSAFHLYLLIDKYNAILSKVDFEVPWTSFWSEIKPLERIYLIQIVQANGGGVFGRRLSLHNIPVDFEDHKLKSYGNFINSEVEMELIEILETYLNENRKWERLDEYIKMHCYDIYLFLVENKSLNYVIGKEKWICPRIIYANCKYIYESRMMDKEISQLKAKNLFKVVLLFYETVHE